ncbi:MAG: MATE family efflux transporter [Clostridiaceae bacterium]|jgi:putative MATE family efflux protein|nr:MATE family efflux transporter [Clostridiaceae bacterium]
MNGRYGVDLTTGSIPKHLVRFSIPMFIGNLLQTALGFTDAMWVGNMVGPNAVGAIQVSFPIQFLLIALSNGATLATTILVSQYYGAGDHEKVKKTVNNSFSVALIFGAILTVAGLLMCDTILAWMDTPPEIFSMASSYLKIIVSGFIITFLVNLITSILRGIGDSTTPLVFMAIAMVINIVLDPILIIGIGPFPTMGFNGSAAATVTSQVIGLVLALVYLNRKKHFVSIDFRHLKLNGPHVVKLFRIGFPSMLQQSLISISSVFITGMVNQFGPDATTAFGASGRIESIVFMPAMSIGLAASALTGQNLGAGNVKRVREVFKWGSIMTAGITLTLSAIILLFPRQLLSLFVRKQEILDIGAGYLGTLGFAYILFALMFVSNGVINGSGRTIITMSITVLSVWLVRLPLAAVLSSTDLGIKGIWLAVVIGFAVGLAASLCYYFTGRWKKGAFRQKQAAAGYVE